MDLINWDLIPGFLTPLFVKEDIVRDINTQMISQAALPYSKSMKKSASTRRENCSNLIIKRVE